MPRDGELWPHISNSRERQLAAIGQAETIREMIEDGKERALGLLDDLSDAFDEIEREAPGSMRLARGWLADVRTEVEGTR